MTYQDKLEDYFWNNLQKDEFILDEIIKLVTLDKKELETEINKRPKLCKILGIEEQIIVGIEKNEKDQSSSEDELSQTSETEEIQTLRMNRAKKEEEPMDLGEGTFNKNSGEKTQFRDLPRSVKEIKSIGIIVLNIDCAPNRKELIDRWAAEISLIIQTNKESYLDTDTILLFFTYKTEGIARDFIKNTSWNDHGPEKVFDEIISSFYTVFLGINLTENRLAEIAKEQDYYRKRLIKLQLYDICELDNFNCEH